ncbi:MAG: type II and III secretion system protein family protein [Alphaproteobacteria bacterium]|nr:type II and III secretion system protein family protein [Alphaproteobacteria bacterium]
MDSNSQVSQKGTRSFGKNVNPNLIRLSVNKSIIVDLPKTVRDVLVSDPSKADAVMRTSRRAYIIGVEVGQTNIFFFDEKGNQIIALELVVERDFSPLRGLYRRLLPGSSIFVESLNDSLILTGSVKDSVSASKAVQIAARFIDNEEKVINMLTIKGRQQVFLKVVIAEVQRSAAKQLGVEWSSVLGSKDNGPSFGFHSEPPFSVSGQRLFKQGFKNKYVSGNFTLENLIQALERNDLLRTLAEPTLTAISGEDASFLAGGEFPIPVSQDNGKVSIEFKPFGVSLGFTPVVLSEGRISLKIQTEVSEVTGKNAFSIASSFGGDGITIRGLRVRRAKTTVELPSGGSLVIAGLIEEKSKHTMNGIPGIKNVPVIGELFRSRDFQNDETEMLVLVTPYLAKPASRKDFILPTDNLAASSDHDANVLGRLNRIYGTKGPGSSGTYKGNVGFIVQ